ncbi:MAG: HPr family phosphocarrier protein [Chitinivibrionales bacterium]|nr:HPr family phosphocarrier protein [Chitinivibrionales bacterium]
MRTRKIIVRNTHGIHARVAWRIAEKSKSLASEVLIYKGPQSASGGSILQLLLLEAAQGTELEVRVQGGDEEKTLDELSRLFAPDAG